MHNTKNYFREKCRFQLGLYLMMCNNLLYNCPRGVKFMETDLIFM